MFIRCEAALRHGRGPVSQLSQSAMASEARRYCGFVSQAQCFLHRARCNSPALEGKYDDEIENSVIEWHQGFVLYA